MNAMREYLYKSYELNTCKARLIELTGAGTDEYYEAFKKVRVRHDDHGQEWITAYRQVIFEIETDKGLLN